MSSVRSYTLHLFSKKNLRPFITPQLQEGFGRFSVASPAQTECIATQEEHHRQVTFQEAFTVLPKNHNIEFAERYLGE